MPAPVGVLLAQVGTPDAPTPRALKRYLAAFLGDRRVVDLPAWKWKPILHGIVLRTRPKRSAALYRNVWTEKGSPLLFLSEEQRAGLAARLGDGFRVALGMRIGEPSLASALDRLVREGCRGVVVLPMFPQFSATTTLSVFDGVAEWAEGRRDLPALSFVRSFPTHTGWIGALVAEVRRAGVRPTREAPLVVAFHGIPKRYADAGDPYPNECRATAQALVKELGLADDAWRIAYQSRFGREEWLQPYCFELLASLPKNGLRDVSVVSAAFTTDCLETIDEIGREAKRIFEEAGGARFVRVPCPNASPEALDALAAIVRAHVPPAFAG